MRVKSISFPVCLALCACLLCTESRANGKVPFRKSAVERKADNNAALAIDEDFSLFAKGSEAEPDNEQLAMSEWPYTIPNEYTHMEGWYGQAIYQAGGCVAIRKYYNPEYGEILGYISTPAMELYGDLTLTFRARNLRPMSEQNSIYLAFCDAKSGPEDSHRLNITDDWKTYTVKTSKVEFGEEKVIQFNPQKGEILVDDIRVERVCTKLMPPTAQPAENHSEDSFTAKWDPVKNADGYLFNLYYKQEPEDSGKGVCTADFNDLHINKDGYTINAQDPNYPEGWKICVNQGGSCDVSTLDYCSAPVSLVLDDESDYIESPQTPAPITGIKFWVKASSMEQEDYPSMFSIDMFVDGKWKTITNCPNYFLEQGGGYMEYDAISIYENSQKVRIYYSQKGNKNVRFYIDDLEISYANGMESVPVIKDQKVDGTEFRIESYDNSKEHYYYVQAVSGGLVSDESEHVWVDGITGLKPGTKEATDVSNNAFTANWTKMLNADQYVLNINKRMYAQEDMEDVVVLHEDFNNITTSGSTYDYYYYLAEKGMADTPWMLIYGSWKKGKAGCMDMSWIGESGLVMSPIISLNANNGQFDLTATVSSLSKNDVVYALVIDAEKGNEIIDYQGIETPAKGGAATKQLHFTSGKKNMRIAFLSYNSGEFYVDDVTITQDLKRGETVSAPYLTALLDNVDTYSVSELPDGFDFEYNVQAKRTKGWYTYYSEISDNVQVRMDATPVENITSRPVHVSNTPVFTINGQIARPNYKGIIISDGKKILKK